MFVNRKLNEYLWFTSKQSLEQLNKLFKIGVLCLRWKVKEISLADPGFPVGGWTH